MIVLDASVLIAHLTTGDAHHVPATRLLLQAPPRSMLVHPLTLAEVLVGGVRLGRGAALRADLRRAGVDLAEQDADGPLRLAELRVVTGLKLPDCCVLDLALSRAADLATFDAALTAAALGRGVAVLPAPSR